MLFAAYAGTMAPGVTMWDAGEFIAAVHSFGIPHEPGTPLYVMLARAWSLLLPFATTAFATNLWSAACTAAAGGLLAAMIARVTKSWAAALAAALCAGGMFTVWSSATETEVYASVMLLVMLGLLAAERAGRTGDARWRVATAYAFALAVPLHISALVAAPAAVWLVAEREQGGADWRSGARLSAAVMFASGVGLASAPITLVGLAGLVLMQLLDLRSSVRGARVESFATLAAALLAISALAVLPIRSHFDPWLNEGAPASLRALWDTVGRRQYGSPGLWPRQSPWWAQIANWFEYADWQVALGLHNDVAPSVARTAVTIVFALLGIVGSREHLRVHARSWRGLAILFAGASAGLVVYLNFKAGASFGFGVLPTSQLHEVRDRDYFFVLGFWVWGAWAGIGAVALARMAGARWLPLGVLAAAAPLVLNALAANRRAEPEASIAAATARTLLISAPPNAVLFTGGDNDTFPAWYAQAAESLRPDVTVVAAPLLGTRWYRAQLARRDTLVRASEVDGYAAEPVLVAAVAREARARGRPVVASLMADTTVRRAAGALTVVRGMVWAEAAPHDPGIAHFDGDSIPDVDTVMAARVAPSLPSPATDPRIAGIDPAPESFLAYLKCPAELLAAARDARAIASLDSTCKHR